MRAVAIIGASLTALALAGQVAADGEAGLVIHWGDGTTSTHCVGFVGEAITGDALLAEAGYNINQFSGLVCAIDEVGCQHSGSFNSCSCECQTGGDDCTYWAFFQQPYGEQWLYSALGVFVSKAEDGDLHSWKWGEGSPASAPAPPATTFEAVCGHAPGAVSTMPPSSTPQAVTTVPGAATAVAPVGATRTPSPTGEPPTIEGAPGTPTPAGSASQASIATNSPGRANTPAPPASGDDDDGGVPGSVPPLVAFAAIAAILVLGAGAALATRSRRGS